MGHLPECYKDKRASLGELGYNIMRVTHTTSRRRRWGDSNHVQDSGSRSRRWGVGSEVGDPKQDIGSRRRGPGAGNEEQKQELGTRSRRWNAGVGDGEQKQEQELTVDWCYRHRSLLGPPPLGELASLQTYRPTPPRSTNSPWRLLECWSQRRQTCILQTLASLLTH